MRIGRSLRVLAGAVGTVIAVGCGTQHAPDAVSQTTSLAAAVSHTQDQTARIATTISTQSKGRTVSVTETGLFDFAHSRGRITLPSPVGMTEIFLPPATYIKPPADGGGLPKGKIWVAVTDGTASAGAFLALGFGGGDPADTLASLATMSGSVTRIGTATIRGVRVTGFALKVDLSKNATKILGADRSGVAALATIFGTAEIPVDVWVDGQNLVRQEKLTLPPSALEGAGVGARTVLTIDFYDFGVPVRVSAPPASQVVTEASQFGAVASGSGGGSAPASPPASGR